MNAVERNEEAVCFASKRPRGPRNLTTVRMYRSVWFNFHLLTQWQTQSDDIWLMSIELKLFAASLYGSATTVPTSYSENRASCQTEVARCELGRVDGSSFRGQCD